MKKYVFVATFSIAVLGLVHSTSFAGGCPGNCNGNGVCNGGTCTCNVGFVGADCGFCAPNYYNYPTCTFCDAAITCSGNGSCSATGSCNCNVGYSGFNCENGPPAVPTVSEWGLTVLTLVGLIAGSILFARRTQASNA